VSEYSYRLPRLAVAAFTKVPRFDEWKLINRFPCKQGVPRGPRRHKSTPACHCTPKCASRGADNLLRSPRGRGRKENAMPSNHCCSTVTATPSSSKAYGLPE
jgi:hypothetical protein